VCRPCTERSLTGHDPRDREPAALNRRTAGHGGISRRKEDQGEEKCGRSSEHYGLLFSDFRPAGAAAHKQRLTAQPQEMFGATRLRFAEGGATRESETSLAESSRRANWD
jgi:hypothetical protein